MAFPEVIAVLSATECSEDKRYPRKVLKKAGASIRRLNPQLKEGLWRVEGRLVNAPFGDERKQLIILPYKHHVTDLIIKQCHENLGHMGQESVLSSLRETVWIVKGRSAVRRVLGKCMTCQRQRNACQTSYSEQSLTPNHLLHLLPCPDLPPGIFDKDDLSCRRAWNSSWQIYQK